MAKTSPKKKGNKRVQKSVRKTFAIVFMITAIVVAAIPVPENWAADGEGEEGGISPLATVQYSYPDTVPDEKITNMIDGHEISLSVGSAQEKPSVYMRKGSNDKWSIEWQFRYFESNGYGVISAYNSAYYAEEVTLNADINLGYEIIEQQQYEDYYANDVKDRNYQLTYDKWNAGQLGSATIEFFEKYVPEAYKRFVEDCEKYKEYSGLTPEEQANATPVDKPNDIIQYVNDHGDDAGLTPEQKLEYYCDDTNITTNHPKRYPGAKLVEVYDRRENSSSTNTIVYMPKSENRGESTDTDGFWYDKNKTARVIAIGDRAFENINNVLTLNLPEEIKFIGEEAFKDSFIEEVNCKNVENVGNRAFKQCNDLTSVSFEKGLVTIGSEAFYGTSLAGVTFPSSTKMISTGAFAECSLLSSVDFKNMTALNSKIKDYAFYNCPALDTVNFKGSNINSIGEAAFALESGQTGGLKEFEFPSLISGDSSKGSEFGDLILAGRNGMKQVTLPADFGRSQDAKIPDNTFYGCQNLEWVKFPDDGNGSCGLLSYDPDVLFQSVINESFYVEGPELDKNNEIAVPRKTTWKAKTLVSDSVPYKYIKGGVEHFEISKDNYLLAGNASGELVSCTLKDPTSTSPLDLVIPSEVAGFKITKLADGCIGEDVKKYLRSVIIEDDSLNEISPGVFADSANLEWVKVGNSVNAIGTGAFQNCRKLTDVTFNSPQNGDYSGFTIGESAFETGSDKLTFRGDIVPGYAPFEWAMAEDNLIDRQTGKRVCYKSIEPTHMTVMRDNETGDVTLLDYPKLINLDEDNKDYCDEMTAYYKAAYSGTEYDENRAGCKGSDDPAHGPWCTDFEYSILDNYEKGENGITPYWDWETISPREQRIIDATRYIVVPEGITSIDVRKYLESSQNSVNIVTYLTSSDKMRASSGYNMDMYLNTKREDGEVVYPGLFSGYLDDFDNGTFLPNEAADFETMKKGNDAIRSITLTGVKTLPDYAFDNCEQLVSVDLGTACTDIGLSPFKGCVNMETVTGNEKFIGHKGIIYEANGDGTFTLLTCLASRGNKVGEATVSSKTDSPYIENTSRIQESAFEDCPFITSVNLEDNALLRTIPKYCFKNCDELFTVVLSDKIDTIQDEAFAGVKPITVTIPDIEVEIATSAFEHAKGVILRSYEDSAVERYANQYGTGFEAMDNRFYVDFLDHDATVLADRQYVQSGSPAEVPADPKRDGYKFTGWKPSVGNMKPTKITADVTFIAQYDPISNNNNNNNNNKDDDDDEDKTNSGNSLSSNNIYSVTVINGTGSGNYKRGETVHISANAPATGKKFDRWETNSLNVRIANVKAQSTSFTMPKNNVVVTAVYDSSSGNSGSGSGGSGSTSGSGGSGSGSSGGSGGSNKGSGSGGTATVAPGTGQSGTTVAISKPGISNTGLASATVDGSTDNFIVRISEDPQATAAVERALTAEYGSLDSIRYSAMDISLYDSTGSVKITDTAGLAVNITLPIPDDLITYAGNNKAGAVVGDSTLEKLNATFKTVEGVPCISFTATHFSPYTIYVDTNNLTAGMDASPKTGDGIHPKWFLAMGLASLSVLLFMKRDSKKARLA